MAKPNKSQPAKPTETTAPRATAPRATAPVIRTTGPSVFGQRNDTLVFGRENYKWMLIGIAIMAVGFVCMSGGAMPNPDVWDESIIYSPMRIIVAPILILIGLAVEVYAIFVQNGNTGFKANPETAE
jgi:Protein of unknown function (DUF3098)